MHGVSLPEAARTAVNEPGRLFNEVLSLRTRKESKKLSVAIDTILSYPPSVL